MHRCLYSGRRVASLYCLFTTAARLSMLWGATPYGQGVYRTGCYTKWVVGTRLVPIGSLSFTFGIIFNVFSMLLAPTFEPNIAKHGPHPPIKLRQQICYDLPKICQDLHNIVTKKKSAYNTPHRNHRPLSTRPARHKGRRRLPLGMI